MKYDQKPLAFEIMSHVCIDYCTAEREQQQRVTKYASPTKFVLFFKNPILVVTRRTMII